MNVANLTTRTTLWFVLLISLIACGPTSALKNIKEAHEKGQYETVVKTEIKCKTSDKSCNQLHLIKGDACFRLGKKAISPISNFDCAIEHLEKGIELTSNWKVDDLDLNQDQTYENLCEALRERQDLSTGKEAEQFTRMLLKTSDAFSKALPENIAAIFFQNSAKFTLLRGPILKSPDDPNVCAAINSILSELKSIAPKAADTKYLANISRLTIDVEGVKPALINCQ